MTDFFMERDDKILAATKRIIEREGLSALTREKIADEAGLSIGSVSNYGLSSITNSPPPSEGYRARILRGLMQQAVERADVKMVRVGLADGCLKLDALPDFLRKAVAA